MLSVHHDHNNHHHNDNNDDDNNHDNDDDKEARGPAEVPELDDAGVVVGWNDVDASRPLHGDHHHDVTIVLKHLRSQET